MEREDPNISLDIPLNSMSYSTRKFLIDCLNESESWRILAESLDIFSNAEIGRFEGNFSPASCLLQELEDRLCTIAILVERLRACKLHMAVYAICGPEKLMIVKQPCQLESSESNPDEVRRNVLLIPYGGTLKLHCKATGLPPPVYAWFRENEELSQTEEILTINNFGSEHVGEYCCRVSHSLPSKERSEEIVSDSVEVDLMPELPEITVQPKPIYCREGTDIKITFSIHELPSLGNVNFQWFKGNTSLTGCTSKDLEIQCVSNSDEGHYRCFLSNKAGEIWTDEAKVTVYQAPEGDRAQRAKEKFALLIGNDEYLNHRPLKTPTSDVETLAKIFKELKFKVIALRNLTLIEMRNALYNFCQMLPVGAYVLFYFVGHGFEIQEKFMLPIDAPAPNSYLRSNSLCETEVIKEVFETQPGLLVVILDMCLLVPDEETNPGIHKEVPPVYKFQPGKRNLVKGYATTSNLGAYERSSEVNGIYAKHLAKALLSHHDLPIVKVLEKVNEGVSNEAPDASEKQMPFVGHNVVKHYCLSGDVEGDEEASVKYEGLVQLPTIMDLTFSAKELKAKAYVTPHRGSFVNSLDVRIVGLEAWNVEFRIENKELRLEKQWTPNGIMVTIHNLQRMKMALFISVELKDPRDGRTVDHDILELHYPLVSKWHLWYKRTDINSIDYSKMLINVAMFLFYTMGFFMTRLRIM